MLGFGALGEFALGEGPIANPPLGGGNFPPATPVRRTTPPRVVSVNLCLIASLGPFAQTNYPLPKSLKPAAPLAAPYNNSLLAQPLRQTDWPAAKRVPLRAISNSSPQNLPLIASLGPFKQTVWTPAQKPQNAVGAVQPNVPLLVQQSTPFVNVSFAVPAKARFALPFQVPNTVVFVPPPDTHDGGVFVKKKRKKIGPDPIELELEEKAKRRAAIELAIYGPEVTYEPQRSILEAPLPPAPPPNVEDLARVMVQVRSAEMEAQRQALEQDDEDVIEMILRDI
jgi:hypothetical protein